MGRTLRIQASPSAERQSARLIAAIDEDALHLRLHAPRRGSAPDGPRSRRPAVCRARSSRTTSVADISSRSARREFARRHRGEPDVGVESDLMRGVAGEHRPAARLRHVADEQARPARGLRRPRREALQKSDELRMAPVAVARQAHDLPVRPVDRQLLAAGETAARIKADRIGLKRRAVLRAAKQLLGRRRRDLRDARAAAGAWDRVSPCPDRWRARRAIRASPAG